MMIITFNDYIKQVSEHIKGNEFWLYRGQSSCDWSLLHSFSRFCVNNKVKFNMQYFNEILGKFIREASCYLEKDLIHSMDYLQSVALAQHYGLPTPFLDWTDSPYIAVFFAICKRSISDNAPFRIWALRVQKDADYYLEENVSSEMAKDFCIIDTQIFDSRRLQRQRGYFSYLNSDMPLEQYLENAKFDLRLFHYDIEGDFWLSIMRELQFMGISHNSLYDNLDGIATDVTLGALYKLKSE